MIKPIEEIALLLQEEYKTYLINPTIHEIYSAENYIVKSLFHDISMLWNGLSYDEFCLKIGKRTKVTNKKIVNEYFFKNDILLWVNITGERNIILEVIINKFVLDKANRIKGLHHKQKNDKKFNKHIVQLIQYLLQYEHILQNPNLYKYHNHELGDLSIKINNRFQKLKLINYNGNKNEKVIEKDSTN
jgi:hypothetical protein